MADINRLCRTVWVLSALVALTACAPGSDPAKTVERDAGVDAVPARPIAGVAQPASPVEGGAAPELWSCVAPTMVAWTSARRMWRPGRALTHLHPLPKRNTESLPSRTVARPSGWPLARTMCPPVMFSFVQAFRFQPAPATMNA